MELKLEEKFVAFPFGTVLLNVLLKIGLGLVEWLKWREPA
jgi:hypothetical protein